PVAADLNADSVTRFRPAPDRVRLAALQNHVIPEDRADEWQGSICRWDRLHLRIDGGGSEETSQQGSKKNGSGTHWLDSPFTSRNPVICRSATKACHGLTDRQEPRGLPFCEFPQSRESHKSRRREGSEMFPEDHQATVSQCWR